MGLRILVGTEGGRDYTQQACMYCSTTGLAFGPTFYGENEKGLDAHDVCRKFIDWLPEDARLYAASVDWDLLRGRFLDELRAGLYMTGRGPTAEAARAT